MITAGPRAKVAIILLAVIALVALALAMIPASAFKVLAERKLNQEIGRPVTIAAIERESFLSFTPILRLTGVDIPQARWAGQGKLASIARLRVRIAVLPALVGRDAVQLVSAEGVTLNLVRDADRRVNWRSGESDSGGAAGAFSLSGIDSVNAVVRYRDAFQNRALRMVVTIDPRRGLVARGSGEIDGNPVTLAVSGPARKASESWPFEVRIAGAAINMQLTGTMAGPMRTDDMTFRVRARARDLKLVDRVIEAGLFGTQPVNLSASVKRGAGRWMIGDLRGTIGSSELVGNLTVDKVDGRSKLAGNVRFARLDFEDLATDAGNAAAQALEVSEGLKIVPNTRINIRKIRNTDGRLAIRIDKIVSRRPSALQSAEGVLTLDHRLLVAKPLALRLTRGVITGEVRVDQRKDQPEPTVTLALNLRDSSIVTLAGGDGRVDAPVDGKVRLAGVGSTVREAVGQSDGTIGLFVRNGSLPTKLASLLGFDVGKSLLADSGKQVTLRCAAVRLDLRSGIGRAAPVVVDTSESQTRGMGQVTFPGERIALTLTGAPKRDAVLRLPGSVSVLGTIRAPTVVVPREVKSFGNVLKAVGRAITGKQGPKAADVDCKALRMRALGGQ